MKRIPTQYLQIDPRQPQPEMINRAATLIKAGELVAFPTETVYGLGADAFQPDAVRKIFMVKGRPSNQPLLIHISNLKQVKQLVTEISPAAQRLMDWFWPGPLSIILPARDSVPEVVRGGQKGIGLRMPAHPVALALINTAGPLAAPSANRFGRPSPTSAQHVRQDMDGMIAAVLDAGETGAGLESTLIDLTGDHYRILRLGGTRVEKIERCLGCRIEVESGQSDFGYDSTVRIVLCNDDADFQERLVESSTGGKNIGIVYTLPPIDQDPSLAERCFVLDVAGQGNGLYSIIREAEAAGIEMLLFAPFEPAQIGEAWLDRLHRAASDQQGYRVSSDRE